MFKLHTYLGRCRTRKNKLALVLLLVLFLSLVIPSAIAGYLKDGPQLEAAPPETAMMEPVIPELPDEVNASLRNLASGAAVTYEADKFLYNAAPETPALVMQDKQYIPDTAEAVMLAKLIWGEARGIKSITEQAAVAWCALNRVDATGYAMGRSVKYVVTFPDQFHGYKPWHTTVDDYGRDLTALAADVLTRWHMEKLGETDVGRVLPKEYMWFEGDGQHNIFRDEYKSKDANIWGWKMPSPYES